MSPSLAASTAVEAHDPPDLIAAHYAGRVGNAIERSMVNGDAAELAELSAEVRREFDSLGLPRNLSEFVGLDEADLGPDDAANSGALHGIVAVAEVAAAELGTSIHHDACGDESAETTSRVDCAELTRSLFRLDFDCSSHIVRTARATHPEVSAAVSVAYSAGVQRSLSTILATVRSLLDRRLVSMISATHDRGAERVEVLLVVALTNCPSSRLVEMLGPAAGSALQRELNDGMVRFVEGMPLLEITADGGMALRTLLHDVVDVVEPAATTA